MSTNPINNTGKEFNRPTSPDEGLQEKSENISLPDNDRQFGPFEHSGETARQTEEERKEEDVQEEQ